MNKHYIHLLKSLLVLVLVLFFKVQCGSAQSSSELNFFGNGNIQKSFDNGEKIPASTGLGVNYIQKYPLTHDSLLWGIIDRLELEAVINVASTVDTIIAESDSVRILNSSDFGSSILTPLNSGEAVKISLRLNFSSETSHILLRLVDGIKLKYVGSNRNWLINDSTSSRPIRGTSNSFRAGIFHEFLPKDLLNEYSIALGLNFAYNSIKGDIGLSSNDDLRKRILGTTTKGFTGTEVTLEIRLRNLRAEFAYSLLNSGEEVPGLTGGRLVTTISFVGGFGLKLK